MHRQVSPKCKKLNPAFLLFHSFLKNGSLRQTWILTLICGVHTLPQLLVINPLSYTTLYQHIKWIQIHKGCIAFTTIHNQLGSTGPHEMKLGEELFKKDPLTRPLTNFGGGRVVQEAQWVFYWTIFKIYFYTVSITKQIMQGQISPLKFEAVLYAHVGSKS